MGRALPEGGSHETRPARQSRSACDIPVRGNPADGDAGHRVPDSLLALGSRHGGHAVGPGLHVTGAGRVGSRPAAGPGSQRWPMGPMSLRIALNKSSLLAGFFLPPWALRYLCDE